MAISDKLTQVNQCKTDIKNSLTNIVDSMSNVPFTEYSGKIDEVGTEVNTQADLISQIVTALEGKAAGGEINLQEKTIYSNGTYTPNDGFDGFSKVIVLSESTSNTLPIAEEASF